MAARQSRDLAATFCCEGRCSTFMKLSLSNKKRSRETRRFRMEVKVAFRKLGKVLSVCPQQRETNGPGCSGCSSSSIEPAAAAFPRLSLMRSGSPLLLTHSSLTCFLRLSIKGNFSKLFLFSSTDGRFEPTLLIHQSK